MEECYKRDMELFRGETMKRDQEVERDRARMENEVEQMRCHIDQAVEFVVSMKKDLIKLQKHIEKKQEQYSSSC